MKGLIYSAAAGIAIAMFIQGMWSMEATHPTMWRISLVILFIAAITWLISSDRKFKREEQQRNARRR